MKFLYILLITIPILIFQSCKSTENINLLPPDEWTPRSWVNLHAADKNLAGVSMRFEKDRTNETFPYMVLYVFWDGTVRQVEHERNGEQVNDFYWPNKVEPKSTLWAVIDYRKGSDPEFKYHDDPRKNVDQSALKKLHPP
jgi:hypothetical protein